jgi:hypothetical protein
VAGRGHKMSKIELIGLVATLFVLCSFLMSGERQIRIINIFGATLFVIYGALLKAPSVWLLNGALLFVHIYKLWKLGRAVQPPSPAKTVFTFNNKQVQR